MADVFSQLYIHIVFAVKNRQALIQPSWETQLHKYITGIVQGRGHKMLAIGGMPDHLHIFIGMKPVESLSELVREIKKSSTTYVKQNKLSAFAFRWQSGYGAFSHSKPQVPIVCRYILNQKEHHKNKPFATEFQKIIADFDIDIGRKELFDFFDEDD